jgi:CTP:molybdopterin cytidylyltransferase MocA
MECAQYVILAAGGSLRMGFDKVTTPIAGVSPLARIVSALGARPFAIVVPSHLADAAARIAPSASIALNDEPERGMTHSLRIGLRCVEAGRAFGVLLGDMPAMTQTTLARTEAIFTGDVDVAYPVDARGTPGHPVLFSACVRTLVEALPDGDTLRRARQDPSLKSATWLCTDGSAFLDLDEPRDWEAFADSSAP